MSILSDKITEQMDEFPKQLIEFSKAYDSKYGNSNSLMNHNIYLLQTMDMYGNITGEAYGINLMTDYGLNKIYKNGSSTSYGSKYIYIGSGTEEPVSTNNTLYSPITTNGSTHANGYNSTSVYGMAYDSTSKIVSCRKRMYIGYFDYNISGITQDTDITEIGYGEAYNKLHTHARIYDKDGNLSSITKRLNERLTITMFWSISFNPSWITSAYDNGVYIVINPSRFLYRDDGSLTMSVYYHPKYSIGDTGRSSARIFGNDSWTTLTDNVMSSKISIGYRFLEDSTSYMCNTLLTDSSATGSQSFFLLTHDKLTQPEEIICDKVFTNAYNSAWLTNLFGGSNSSPNNSSTGTIPATNFDIQSLYMYNHLTKEWDIEESFDNNPDYEYLNTTHFYVNIWMYIPFLSKVQNVYVYVNTRTDLPINSFGTSGMTLYATDEYWNADEWILIDDTSTVPTELRSKRYYVRLDTPDYDRYDIQPYRSTVTRHRILTIPSLSLDVTESVTPGTGRDSAYLVKPLSNDDSGWLATYQHFVFPDADNGVVKYPITNISGRRTHHYFRWATNDRFISITNTSSWSAMPTYPNSIRIHDLSKCPTEAPSYTDINTLTTFNGIPWYSFTENGYLVMQSLDSGVNIAEILDIYGKDGTPTSYQISDAQYCYALNLSDNCVYQTTDTEYLSFNIFDMRTKSVIDTFSLPVSGYTLVGISGWREFVYIRVELSGSYSTYVYNINEKQLTYYPTLNVTDMNFKQDNVVGQTTCYSVSECFIIGKYLFTPDHLGDPILLYDSNTYDFDWYTGGCQLKYVNDGKQLLFTIPSNRKFAIDVGRVIDTWTPQKYIPRYHFPYTEYSGFYRGEWMIGLYKNYVYMKQNASGPLYLHPIENFVAHKMTGTTTTIQSYNNPKKVGSKTYQFSITNDTSNWGISIT